MTTPAVQEPKKVVVRSVGKLFIDDSRAAHKVREKLAADGMQKFQRAQSDRWKQERQWYLNLAFFFGNHHVKFRSDETTQRFSMYVPGAPYYRVRPVINHVRKIVRKEVSRLTSQQPNAYIVPASMEDRDLFAAQAGEQIWASIWREHKLNRTLRQAAFWQTVCGNAFIKQWWDQYKLDKTNDKYGNIAIKAETPFHIFVPDLKEEDLEEQPCLIHAKVVNREWLANNFGITTSSHDLNVVDESLLSVMGINNQDRNETAIILEVWEKPGYNPQLPEGGMYTIAANQVVQGWEGWPYEHGEYPLSKLDGIPTGKFYNDSIVADLIPLQRQLNRARGQVIEAMNRMAKPQLAAEEGSIVASKITSEPGQIIFYKPGFNRPDPMPMQNLPGYVSDEISRTYTDMADLAGFHEVSQGQTPPGVTAAVAISYLQEQDESLISTHFDSLEEAIEKTAGQCLIYVQQFWDEERTIRVAGADSSFDVLTFRGSQLKGNTDIRVESGSALPTSRAAKQAFIMDMMKMGFIEVQDGLEVMELGGLNKIYEKIQVDIRHAQRENLKLSILKEEDIEKHIEIWNSRPEHERIDPMTKRPLLPPPVIKVNSYDNHKIHIERHNRFRKSQAFEMAPPHVKRQFEMHVKMHEDAITAQLTLEQAMGSNPLQPDQGLQGQGQMPIEEEPPPQEGMVMA